MNIFLAITWDVKPVLASIPFDYLKWFILGIGGILTALQLNTWNTKEGKQGILATVLFTIGAFLLVNFLLGKNPDRALELRYYSLLWALSFLVGFYIIKAIFDNEGKDSEDLDSLFIYMILGTVLGARIGHCLFYENFKEYFIDDPLKVFKVWEGGLASHGAVIGILFALFLFVKKNSAYKKLWPITKIVKPKYTYIWILDRMVVAIALGGAFIRLGNFFNSEIVGQYTKNDDSPLGILFVRHYDSVLGHFDKVPRVPVQLFESISYFIIFFFLFAYYWKNKGKFADGLLLGAFFVTVFGARFILEFWKVADKTYWGLNTGHVLSIPVVLIGLYLWIRAIKQPKLN